MTTRETAEDLTEKLEEFARGLSPEEQRALANLLVSFDSLVRRAGVDELVSEVPGAKALLQDVEDHMASISMNPAPLATTITITTITLTTTLASTSLVCDSVIDATGGLTEQSDT